jgi:hypothetical protein
MEDDTLVDIFSQLIVAPQSYMLVSRLTGGATKRRGVNGDTPIYPPELALSVITSILVKLGAIEDWCTVCNELRGIAILQQLCKRLSREAAKYVLNTINKNWIMLSMPEDTNVLTVVGEIAEDARVVNVCNTNLQSSSVMLICECVAGQLMMNNLYYMCEMSGLYSSKIVRNNERRINECIKIESGMSDYYDPDRLSQMLMCTS